MDTITKKEEKKQQDIQLEKWGKLDQKELSSSMKKVLLEMKEKLNSRSRINQGNWK